MPEGDAVWLTARRLDRALAGQVLTASSFRVPQLATTDLTGARVDSTATHGKHLLTRLTTVDGQDLTLHTHLKMEGVWRVVAPRGRWPRPAHEARVVLHTERAEAIGFTLGLVELLPTADEHTIIGHLGPDILGPWTADDEAEAVRRLTAVPSRPLGEALLDQTNVAGFGTIWVAESSFVNGANPMAPVAEVRDPARFLRRGRLMIQAAVREGRPVTTGNKREPLWAYRRHRQPCRRCGTTMVAGQLGDAGRERTTYWCPSCQPMTS
ncbi:MAG TPA: DNA-formamidopyrimidine glycosylase family protein [Nocardioides sp.]|nr:DNA-formamidopyrimidine glycosylase family protein [Nocardioides sp.]